MPERGPGQPERRQGTIERLADLVAEEMRRTKEQGSRPRLYEVFDGVVKKEGLRLPDRAAALRDVAVLLGRRSGKKATEAATWRYIDKRDRPAKEYEKQLLDRFGDEAQMAGYGRDAEGVEEYLEKLLWE